MNIAVFGTRTLGDFTAVDELVLSLQDGDMLMVDGKLGVSNYAKNKASFRYIPIKHYPANYKRDGNAADFIRNHRMVDESDEVHVYYNVIDEVLKDILAYCEQVGKPVQAHEVPGQLYTEL